MSISWLGRALLARRISLAASRSRPRLSRCPPMGAVLFHRTTARLDSTNQEHQQQPGRYIDRVLEELSVRGLKQDSDINTQNAFQLFNLEPQFLIDQRKLKKELRTIMMLLHPDKFVRKDADSQRISEHLSAIVNGAYETLMNPYKRAKYLLSLSMEKTADQIEESLDHLQLDPEFLARMMELREKIDTCQRQELAKLRAQLDVELDNVIGEVKRDFDERDYESVLKKLGKLKFLANCHEACTRQHGDLDSF